ncbi:MAG: PrgI family protein [Lachnospiraceae bacterium]|nr:PrgI family protein [Lachnospiraceae bacterium]
MAAYIPVPRDLTKVKTKVAFNLTKRQLICFSVAGVIGIPSFFLVKHFCNVQVASIIMIVVMMPMFFLALYEKNGMFPETLFSHFIEAMVIRPKARPYKVDNYYAALMRENKAEREVDKIVRNSEKTLRKKKGHR